MSRELVLYPSDGLEQKCEPVSDPTDWDDLRDRMAEVLYDKNGIGLAAPQVGEAIELFLLRLDPDQRLHEAYFNPEILEVRDRETLTEGCLSFPNIEVGLERGTEVTFEALTPTNERVERTVTGLQAQCVQHEVDHLREKTLLDRCSLTQKMEIQDRLEMLEDGEIPPPLEKSGPSRV